jgi:hypothetical protein
LKGLFSTALTLHVLLSLLFFLDFLSLDFLPSVVFIDAKVFFLAAGCTGIEDGKETVRVVDTATLSWLA